MPTHERKKVKPKSKHSGGPIRRTDDEWNQVLGSSLDEMPQSKLPLVGTILRRYRSLRISKPLESKATLSTEIAAEVQDIWKRAHIPTAAPHNCSKKVEQVISLPQSCHNPGELEP